MLGEFEPVKVVQGETDVYFTDAAPLLEFGFIYQPQRESTTYCPDHKIGYQLLGIEGLEDVAVVGDVLTDLQGSEYAYYPFKGEQDGIF